MQPLPGGSGQEGVRVDSREREAGRDRREGPACPSAGPSVFFACTMSASAFLGCCAEQGIGCFSDLMTNHSEYLPSATMLGGCEGLRTQGANTLTPRKEFFYQGIQSRAQ